MTDESVQPTQSATKQESAALKQTGDEQQESQQQQQRGYNNYNNGSNYTQKKPYNGNRPHQQRGGKFGPNRYNSRGNYNGGGSYRGGHVAVSYTHLDVYKRQAHLSEIRRNHCGEDTT